jgi:choice-of-anchor C domain-containing protein
MRKKKMKIRMMLVMFCVLAITPAIFAQSNGSFEQGTNPGPFSTQVNPGNTNIVGWSVDFGSVDYIGTFWKASQGTRSVDLNGNQAGQISQTFATVPGTVYQVTFDLSGNPDGGCSLKMLAVSATGAGAQTYTYDTCASGNTRADMKWATYTYTFEATSDSTTLSFTSLIAGLYGPALDNVRVQTITQVCHRNNRNSNLKGKAPKDGEYKTLKVDSLESLNDHLGHGDTIGPCTVDQ